MKTYSRDGYEKEKPAIIEAVKAGAVFIYPTDTVYGIGCIATDAKAVARLRQLKGNAQRPLSVMVPSKDWILDNCYVKKEHLNMLPGPYTLVLKMKRQAVAENVSKETLGVRIPDCWATELASISGLPIITTSANISGQRFMTSLSDIDRSLAEKADFIVDSGLIDGRPSKVIDLTGDDAKVLRE